MRPECGHVPDEAYAAEAAIPAADIARDADALFACDFIFSGANQARSVLSVTDAQDPEKNFVDGDTLTLDAEVYTFVEALTDPAEANEVLIGATPAKTLENLVAAVTGAPGEGTTYGEGTVAHATVTASPRNGNQVTFYAIASGASGNSIATETDAAEPAFDATTMDRGADASQGILFALGNDTTGLLVGINGDGELVARFGDGAAPPLTNGARAVVAAGLVPRDRVTKLAVAVHISEPAEIVVWFDGRQAARADMEGTLTDWAANADGAFIDVPAAIPDETGITAAYDGTILSDLRYHARRSDKYRTGV